MEHILDLYARPHDVRRPLVCLDEHPVQLIAETREPIPAKGSEPEKYDYEYKRMGTCNLFVYFDPGSNWRHVEVTESRTKKDFAHQLKLLVDVLYPKAEYIDVVLDNLNTHKLHSLYEVFKPEEAARIREKLRFHYTPVHGSWLNMVEIEIGIIGKQCLNRCLPDIEMVRNEISAWENQRNKDQAGIDWSFTADKAREKLKRLYPSISA